jgi:hypothetical protein
LPKYLDRESAGALVAALPLLDVDRELVSDQEFRDLLAAPNFEETYNPSKTELTHPDGQRAPLLFVPPAGFEQRGARLFMWQLLSDFRRNTNRDKLESG